MLGVLRPVIPFYEVNAFCVHSLASGRQSCIMLIGVFNIL